MVVLGAMLYGICNYRWQIKPKLKMDIQSRIHHFKSSMWHQIDKKY